MTLRHLKIYIEVYRLENVTKAADALHMTQPAVSRSIQEIERYYNVRLFERIHHRLYVTELGKEFYAYALHIMDSFEQMEQGLRTWDEYGILRIGTSISIGTFLLPKVLLACKTHNPHLKIKSTVSNWHHLQQALLNNELDFVVMEGGMIPDMLHAQSIAQDCLVPVLPPNAPERNTEQTLQELVKNPLLLREYGSAGRGFLEHIFAIHHIQAEPLMESISTQAILQSVHMGLGISFLPKHLVEESIANGFVATCQVSDETFCRDNYIVWHKQKFITKSAKETMDFFRLYAKA